MNGFLDILSGLFHQTGVIDLLINLILKGTLILLLAFLANFLLRSASAAARHWVWCLAFSGLLLLLPFSLLLPKKPIPVLPQASVSFSNNEISSPVISSRNEAPKYSESSSSLEARSSQSLRAEDPKLSSREIRKMPPVKAESPPVKQQGTQFEQQHNTKGLSINWSALILVFWVSGTFYLLLRLAWSLARIYRVSSRGEEVTDKSLKKLLEDCRKSYGIQSRVRMKASGNISVPATSGVFRTVLLLPQDISTWPRDKQKVVISHELAHVKRRDNIFNLVAQIAGALYWFNPLVWMAVRSFWMERENACDDFVLENGVRDFEYADHLLEIACRFSRMKLLRRYASVMASKSDLKQRLRHILSKKTRRCALTLKALAISIAGVLCILLPLATASIQEKQNQNYSVMDLHRKSLDGLIDDLQDRNPEVRLQAAWALGDREDEDAVPSLIQALKDKDPEVRGMVAWALGEIKDKSAMFPLIAALDDKNPYALEMMVKALGELEDETASEPLAQVFKDKNPDVRTAVIWAMGEIEGPEAFEIVIKALKDPAVKVREMAVAVLPDFRTQRTLKELESMLSDREAVVRGIAARSLGNLKSRSSVDALVKVLGDREAKVRVMAAWALGEIGDPRAVDPLIKLLRDKDPDVRAMAVWSLDEISLY